LVRCSDSSATHDARATQLPARAPWRTPAAPPQHAVLPYAQRTARSAARRATCRTFGIRIAFTQSVMTAMTTTDERCLRARRRHACCSGVCARTATGHVSAKDVRTQDVRTWWHRRVFEKVTPRRASAVQKSTLYQSAPRPPPSDAAAAAAATRCCCAATAALAAAACRRQAMALGAL
jgi:hypothetical protein